MDGAMTENVGGNAKEQLKSIIERVENLQEQRSDLAQDISQVYQEAKGNGFDTKALRHIIRMRAEDPEKRAERETIVKTYLEALGMQ